MAQSLWRARENMAEMASAADITSEADGATESRATNVQKHQSEVTNNFTESVDRDSWSLTEGSDLNFSCSNDFREEKLKTNNNMALQFLPSSFKKAQRCNGTELSCEVMSADSFIFDGETSPDQSFEASSQSVSDSLIQQFDFISMKEKLEAQKEYLFDSFEKPPVVPQSLLKNYQSDYKVKKLGSLTLKGKLRKLGRAARHFVNHKIFKRQPLKQRCEIQLDGFDDRVERLIVMISQHQATNIRGTVHVHLPSFFETHQISVPRFLLPSRQGEMMTVTVYGIAGPEKAEEPTEFMEIVVSGVCTVHLASKPLLSAKLVLQPHWLGLSLAGIGKSVQTGGTRIETTYKNPNNYTFSTAPVPVATDFTELCVVQKADPFKEYLALSTSSCDQPATFQAGLSPGQYYGVCSYRLTSSPVREVFAVAAATPSAYFKAYLDKARITEQMKQAAEQADHGVTKDPVLCPSLLLLKPPGLDVEDVMWMFSSGNTNKSTKSSSTTTILDEGLYFCAWDVDTGDAETEGTPQIKSWYPLTYSWTVVHNPRLPAGSREYTRIPSLSVFTLGTRLFFADSWSYYDKHYVTLVLCAKGSPCHQVCKRHLRKLDPYNNPFLFRKRCFEPEPSVEVYSSAHVNVEVIHSNSDSVQQLIALCSENVYFSKVRIDDKSSWVFFK